MSRPLRANLKIVEQPDGEEVRCTRCEQVYGPVKEDWRKKAHRLLVSPTSAGPFREELLGRFSLQQYSCPSCGALLETAMVEAEG